MDSCAVYWTVSAGAALSSAEKISFQQFYVASVPPLSSGCVLHRGCVARAYPVPTKRAR
jgi:hypothetical protein